MKRIILLSVVMLALVSCGTTKLSREEEALRLEFIAGQIKLKDYLIEAEQMSPARGRTIQLTGGYSLKVKGDSAMVYLPYWGRANSAPYGGEGGIKFEEKMRDYESAPNQKGDGWDISFKVDTPNLYQYQFFINVYENGRAAIQVVSPQRDPISFSGSVNTITIDDALR